MGVCVYVCGVWVVCLLYVSGCVCVWCVCGCVCVYVGVWGCVCSVCVVGVCVLCVSGSVYVWCVWGCVWFFLINIYLHVPSHGKTKCPSVHMIHCFTACPFGQFCHHM